LKESTGLFWIGYGVTGLKFLIHKPYLVLEGHDFDTFASILNTMTNMCSSQPFGFIGKFSPSRNLSKSSSISSKLSHLLYFPQNPSSL